MSLKNLLRRSSFIDTTELHPYKFEKIITPVKKNKLRSTVNALCSCGNSHTSKACFFSHINRQ